MVLHFYDPALLRKHSLTRCRKFEGGDEIERDGLLLSRSCLDDHFLEVSVMRQEADEMHGNLYFRFRPEADRQEDSN
jgi:hypothetical protein